MGRKRFISADRILDAAQQVVAAGGAGQLTLDAVADEAGISKASVLYLYKTKRALIEAVIRRGVEHDAALNEAAIERAGDAVVRGRVAAAGRAFPEADRSVALELCAAAAHDPQLRRPMQEFQQSMLSRIAKTADQPRGATLAHLALEGLKLLELLGFHTFSKAERSRLLREIEWLAGADPAPAGLRRAASRVASTQPRTPATATAGRAVRPQPPAKVTPAKPGPHVRAGATRRGGKRTPMP